MKTYDISIPIKPGMPTWPGDPPVNLRRINSIDEGDHANISQLQMCVHTGTHIDAPNHFLADEKTVDQLPIESLVGETLVMEINPDVEVITDEVLEAHSEVAKLKKYKRVLFKTRNSKRWYSHPQRFNADYVGIDTSGANYLARMNLSLIGLDYLSIAAYHDTHQPHQILLSQEVILLEGINLRDISAGIYQLFCAPLLIEGCEGAPARAFLVKQYH